jgi:hypothetical protein
MSEINGTVDTPPPPPDPPDNPPARAATDGPEHSDRPGTQPGDAEAPADTYDPTADLEPQLDDDSRDGAELDPVGRGIDGSTDTDYDPVADIDPEPAVDPEASTEPRPEVETVPTEATDTTELDDRLQEHFDRSEVTENGRAFYGEGPGEDRMREASHDVQTDPDRYTIDMHGDAYSVGIGDDTLTPDDLATLLEHDPNYDGGPIRLFSCTTGAEDDGFAQQFADRMEVDVTAPTMAAWTNANGENWVGEPTAFDVYENPTEWEYGEWRVFHPRGDS